ncbi:hypothetical protein BH11MYX4_BH11MYX4_26020 [soil metagenome]
MGALLGELADLAASLHGLALGSARLDAASVNAAAVAPIEIAFADLQPTKLEVGLQGLALEGVTVAL